MFSFARMAKQVEKILCIFFMCSSLNYGAEPNSPAPGNVPLPKLPIAGNFILPNSQQPGPLIGIGENIVDKGEVQLYLFADNYVTNAGRQVDIVPGLLYGISDSLSIFANLPIAADVQQYNQRSSGLEDAFLQVEYAYYATNTKTYSDQATILASVSVPTGNYQQQPPIGYGAPTYLLGTTFNRTYQNWVIFGSPDIVITTSRNGTKFGKEYYYQFGFGRNIADIGTSWMFDWLLEIDGTYTERNRINGVTDPNSGGNLVYVTPSIWISSKNLIIQAGIGLPASQNLYGDQPSNNYLIAINLGWTFS